MADRILIDTYRGIEIYFNLDKEAFYASIDDPSYSKDRQSYAATKKAIDEFIKENSEFKPFFVERKGHRGIETLKIVGIRKDGAYVYEDEKGAKIQLSKYSESDYYISSPELKEIVKKIDALKEKIAPLEEEKRQLENEIKRLPSLSTVKEKYIQK